MTTPQHYFVRWPGTMRLEARQQLVREEAADRHIIEIFRPHTPERVVARFEAADYWEAVAQLNRFNALLVRPLDLALIGHACGQRIEAVLLGKVPASEDWVALGQLVRYPQDRRLPHDLPAELSDLLRTILTERGWDAGTRLLQLEGIDP